MIREGQVFRPWGLLNDILSGFPSAGWGFIGCASMEERSTCVFSDFQNFGNINTTLIFRIKDDHSRYSDLVESKTDSSVERFRINGLNRENIKTHFLRTPFGIIESDISNFFISLSEQNLIIDITSLPKRIFFYVIREALSLPDTVQNIVVTYTEPNKYDKNSLAENPERWNTLPGFNGPRAEPSVRKIVISIGYEPLGLPDLVMSGEFDNAPISLLFPFPSTPRRVTKNWNFARNLFPNIDINAINIKRVDGVNVPEVYDAIGRIGDFGDTYLTLAPFGPKPISLAMALYAVRHSHDPNPTRVCYTQPSIYNPNYSEGVKVVNGCHAVNSYCIRINGSNLY